VTQVALLGTRRFLPLFLTQFLGAFNDNFVKSAMVILVNYRGMTLAGLDARQVSLLAGALFILPYFVFSATAGQLADKYEKARVIRIIKGVEVGLALLALVGYLLPSTWVLLVVVGLLGVHSTFFGPLKYSILPQLLRDDELVGGNALVEMGTNLAILLGTLAGGLMVALPEHWPWACGLTVLAVALAGYGASRGIPPAPAADPELRVQWNPLPPTLELFRLVQNPRSVFLSILGISWFWLFGAAFINLLPSYVHGDLRGNEQVSTLFLALFSVGVGVGSLLCEKLSFGRLELGLVPFGSMGMSLFAFDLGLARGPAAAGGDGLLSPARFVSDLAGLRILFDMAALALFAGLFIVPLYTLVQQRSQAAVRSRVIAGNNVINAFFMVISSAAIAGLLGLGLSIPQIFAVLAVANALVAVYIYSVIPEFFLRFLVWILSHFFYRLRARGLENIPAEGPAVLVCNHVSFVDWLVISAAVRRPVRYVMHHSYRVSWLGWLFRDAKVIPIAGSRENPEMLERAMEQIARELAEGELVCLFPEGRLTPDGEIQPFRKGIEQIVGRSPVPVVPMALRHMWGSLFSRYPGRRLFPRGLWRRIELVVGEPVPPEQVTAQGLQERVATLRGEAR
jgi:1-acyl-sn-glycerol-3-phosphate acyltransferase